MRKINNSGFTLVELLVVIVILVIIMSIAIPSVTSSLERSKEKQKNAKIDLIESAAEIYVDRHKNTITNGSVITINNLIKEGLLTIEEAKDPFNEKRTLCGHVIYQNNKYTLIENLSGCITIQ